MEHIDEQKNQGNDLCKLLCNLGSLEPHLESMRKKVNESLTRSKVVAEIAALKSEELST